MNIVIIDNSKVKESGKLFEDGTRKPGIYYATIFSYIENINIKEWCYII